MLYFRGHAHSGVQAYATWISNEMEPKYVFPPPHLPQKRVEIQSIPLREVGTGPRTQRKLDMGVEPRFRLVSSKEINPCVPCYVKEMILCQETVAQKK